jgi:hypothetical protein
MCRSLPVKIFRYSWSVHLNVGKDGLSEVRRDCTADPSLRELYVVSPRQSVGSPIQKENCRSFHGLLFNAPIP